MFDELFCWGMHVFDLLWEDYPKTGRRVEGVMAILKVCYLLYVYYCHHYFCSQSFFFSGKNGQKITSTPSPRWF